MKRKLIRISVILLVLVGLPLAGWRAFLAIVMNKKLADIRAAGLPTNGEELNRWYPAVPDNQNAALVLTQAFDLRQLYQDGRSNLIINFKLPKRGEALSPEQTELLHGYIVLNEACLRKADEALKLTASRYPIDCTQLMSTLLPHLTWLKKIAEVYQYSALIAMASGNGASASTNIETMLALSRTLDAEPCLISQLVKLKLIGMAFTTLEHRANVCTFSSVEIKNLRAAFLQTSSSNMIRGVFYFVTFDFSQRRQGEFSVGITVSNSAEKSVLNPSENSQPSPTHIGSYSIAAFLGRPAFRWDLGDVDAKTNATLASLGGIPIPTSTHVAANTWKPSSYELPFAQIANEAIRDVSEKLRRCVFPKLEIVN